MAKDYQNRGYKVIIEPRGADIPSFIKNYQPDLIVSNDKETVIIEVKTRSDFSTINELRDIAELVNKKGNWRFELIVTNPKQSSQTEDEITNVDLNFSDIEANIKEVKSALNNGLFSTAFVLCWASLESLSRQLLLEDKKALKSKNTIVLIKTLFSFGYLTRTDYESLEKLLVTRNHVVHGYKSSELNIKSVEKLLSITQKLLTEKQ